MAVHEFFILSLERLQHRCSMVVSGLVGSGRFVNKGIKEPVVEDVLVEPSFVVHVRVLGEDLNKVKVSV